MLKLKLHLDADTSSKSLHSALVSKRHDVTRTPNDWMSLNASDKTQLLRSTAQGRCIFTFNVRDFIVLSQQYPQQGASQFLFWNESITVIARRYDEAIHRIVRSGKFCYCFTALRFVLFEKAERQRNDLQKKWDVPSSTWRYYPCCSE